MGTVDDLVATMTGARAMLVPIWHGGGTRLKALEALASARPTVGTPLGLEGIGFEPGVHGLSADDPRGLADALVRVLADEALSRQFAADARRWAWRLRWSETLAPAKALYEELLVTPA
jgi:glycosyltransferase involved in cell wall biosynthesis